MCRTSFLLDKQGHFQYNHFSFFQKTSCQLSRQSISLLMRGSLVRIQRRTPFFGFFDPFVQWLRTLLSLCRNRGSNPLRVARFINFRSLSSVGRAPPLQGGCHKFESYSDHHFRCSGSSDGQNAALSRRRSRVRAPSAAPFVLLAQSVEHFTFNEGVAGSSPAQDTIYFC